MNRQCMENEIVKHVCIDNDSYLDQIKECAQHKILGLLCMHRCAGLAYYNLKNGDKLSLLQREMASSLQSIYEDGLKKQSSVGVILWEFVGILQEADFTYALLMEARLKDLYPEGTRVSDNISILINRKDLRKMTELLLENSFQQGYIHKNKIRKVSDHDAEALLEEKSQVALFVKQENLHGMKHAKVIVNFYVDRDAENREYLTKTMLDHADDCIFVNNEPLYTLDDLDFLIHLCINLYRTAASYEYVQKKRDLALYKFIDIYLFWKTYISEEKVIELLDRIREYQVEKAVFYSLYHVSKLWSDNRLMIDFLEEFLPEDMSFLNQVYDSETKIIYQYKDSFTERIFNERHNDNLSPLSN